MTPAYRRIDRLLRNNLDDEEYGEYETALGAVYGAGTEQWREACNAWSDKTDWVQETATPKELGLHRADVIRSRFEALTKQNEELKKALQDIAAITKGTTP